MSKAHQVPDFNELTADTENHQVSKQVKNIISGGDKCLQKKKKKRLLGIRGIDLGQGKEDRISLERLSFRCPRDYHLKIP